MANKADYFMKGKRTPEEVKRRNVANSEAANIKRRGGMESRISDAQERMAKAKVNHKVTEATKAVKKTKMKRGAAIAAGIAAGLGGIAAYKSSKKDDLVKKARLETRGKRVAEDAKTGAKIGGAAYGIKNALQAGALLGPAAALKYGAAGALIGSMKGGAVGGLVGLARKRKQEK